MSVTSRSGAVSLVRGGLLLLAAGLLALAACTEQRLSLGTQLDLVSPTVSIAKTSGSTMDVASGLRFSVNAGDNLGLKTVSIVLSGGYTARIDTTFRTAVTTINLPILVTFPTNTTAGGQVIIQATAVDGNNNSATARDSILLTNVNALIVTLIKPVPGGLTSPGKQVLIDVIANQNNGIKKVGWISTGVVTGSDSIVYLVPLPDTGKFTDTLTVPGTVTSGTFAITGFAEDSSGRRVLTPPVTVSLLTVASDTTPPIVTFTVGQRVEVRDSITVRALDPSGITSLSWTATDLAGATVGGATFTSGGTLTDVSQTFNLNFAFTGPFPVAVIIGASAVDGNGNVGFARTDTIRTAPLRLDTITVVAGITRRLPAGGRVADAVYNKNLDEIYLTNVDLNRVEVFRIADTAFNAFAFVGSRPWGIALWPGDTVAGTNGDSVIVANSGGTNLSIVDMGLRREVSRRALPIFTVASVQTSLSPTGFIQADITEHLFADRPAYLAAVCRGQTCKPRGAGDVIAVYSTTPTKGQSGGFPLRGTMRWENITGAAPESHFFWEHAAALVKAGAHHDTLRIEVVRGTTVTRILDENCGATVTIDELAFLDTTFVRNSGNFGRILVGEAGSGSPPLIFARALSYDGNAGITPTCTRLIAGVPTAFPLSQDLGISPAANVRNLITNAAAPVRAIAINFNGLTQMIRADSIYVFDRSLRLQGLLQVPGPYFGMDLNFDHKFDAGNGGTPPYGGTLSPNDRLLFAARPDANIDVFDTYFYARVATIPLRDPVTGLLRVAKLGTGEQVLIGVTDRGIVVARLQAITNTYQARIWGAPRN